MYDKKNPAWSFRMDDETKAAVRQIAQITGRTKGDAVRWCVREMARTLAAPSSNPAPSPIQPADLTQAAMG